MAGRHGEEIRHLFTDDAVTVEHPNALKPRGATMGLEEMLAGSTAGARLLTRQAFEVHQVVENGDEVVVRLTWAGQVREAAGPFAGGAGAACAHRPVHPHARGADPGGRDV